MYLERDGKVPVAGWFLNGRFKELKKTGYCVWYECLISN